MRKGRDRSLLIENYQKWKKIYGQEQFDNQKQKPVKSWNLSTVL